MAEGLLLIGLTALYLVTFIIRNNIVKKRTKLPVRSTDKLLRFSIIFSSMCFLVANLSTHEKWFFYMAKLTFLRSQFIEYTGFLLFTISIVMGWFISAQLKDSWRVGVLADQKTMLIKDGIYAYIRNPYFVSYYIMYFSLLLIRPSFVLLFLVVITVALFHKMVLKEETHLMALHGTEYEEYKAKTGRYLPQCC